LKLIFAGTPANAAVTLRWLLASGHEVVTVLTRPDAPIGRKRVVTPSPVAQLAEDAGIPVIKATKVDEAIAAEIAQTGAQLGVVVAYGALLKRFALQALPLGWVNLHYSLLPDWRGAAPVQNSILHGDRETGVTLFQLDEGMDTGPVLSSVSTTINPGENAGRLLERLTDLGNSLLGETLPLIDAGLVKPVPQPTTGPIRQAVKLFRQDALVDWNKPAGEIENLVLALNPEPMAHTFLKDQPFRVIDARAVLASARVADLPAGTLHVDNNRVLVACGSGTALELLIVQPAGKNQLAASDWARGNAADSPIFQNNASETPSSLISQAKINER
jgi:methionyl-tRNA formyltransferase